VRDPAANFTEIPSTFIAGILGAVGVVVVVLIIATMIILVMITLRKRRYKTPVKSTQKVTHWCNLIVLISHAHCNDYVDIPFDYCMCVCKATHVEFDSVLIILMTFSQLPHLEEPLTPRISQ